MAKIKVMVVDDTILYRKIVGDVLSEMPDVEVVGTANNGKIAFHKMAHRFYGTTIKGSRQMSDAVKNPLTEWML